MTISGKWDINDYEVVYTETVETSAIKRSDNAFIPMNENNKDYQEYLELKGE